MSTHFTYSKIPKEHHSDNTKEWQNTKIGLLSRLTFSWISSLISLGKSRPLEETDIYEAVGQEKSKTLTEKLGEVWRKEKGTAKCKGKQPKLWKAALVSLKMRDCVFLVFTILADSTCRILQAVLLSFLLSELVRFRNVTWVWVTALALCLTALIQLLVNNHYFYRSFLLGTHLKAALTGLVYQKVLTLSEANLADVTSGHVVNLVSKDTLPILYTPRFIFYIITAPLEILVLGALLWILVGVETLTSLVFVVLSICYQISFGGYLATLRARTAQRTDKRLALITDVISGIRAIKMNVWEGIFKEFVTTERRQEVNVILQKSLVLAGGYSMYSAYTLIATFIALSTLYGAGHTLTAQNVFTTHALLSLVGKFAYGNFALAVDFASKSWITFKRMEAFLMNDDQNVGSNEDVVFDGTNYENRKLSKITRSTRKSENLSKACDSKGKCEKDLTSRKETENEPLIKYDSTNTKNSSLSVGGRLYSDDEKLQLFSGLSSVNHGRMRTPLRNIDIELTGSKLLAVTGPVGSGKSSLLQVIIGELPILKGKISFAGQIAHVPQTPWLFSGTIRDNILFGRTFDQQRYEEIIKACALKKDFEAFVKGDLTAIGERGVSLSGGQQSRVTLARAVYSEADVYLLDDPFSAVDARVEKQIFEQCICQLLSHRPRILVTHQIQFLKAADEIIVMNKGFIANRGAYSKLEASGEYFEYLKHPNKSFKENNCSSANVDDIEEYSFDKQTIDSLGDDEGLGTMEEDRLVGTVSCKTYLEYFKAALPLCLLCLFFLLLIVPEVACAWSDLWLVHWSNLPSSLQRNPLNRNVYSDLVCLSLVLTLTRATAVYYVAVKASEKLHNKMLMSLLKTHARFFDTNPAGRILNRFAKDIGCMDELLPEKLLSSIQSLMFTITAIVLASVADKWITIASLPLIVIVVLLGRFYLQSAREIKRIEAVSASPVYAHLSDTIQGVVTVRAYRKADEFQEKLYRLLDHNNKAWLAFQGSRIWLGVRMDFLCFLFLLIVTSVAIITSTNAALVGLSISYVMQLIGCVTLTVMDTTVVENYMTSVERVMTYTQLESEPGYGTEKRPPNEWPGSGQVSLKDVFLVYNPGGPEILKGVTCHVKEGEKIGVVGRTGAGKSSMVSALLRMPEATGEITIDGINIHSINLQDSRVCISVISQRPFLFRGSLRLNIDPLTRFTDAELWSTLEEVRLKPLVEETPEKLECQVNESGSNFSAGERQLICLARAMLQRNKIVVLDEATANVDNKTDQLIQNTINNKFKGCTVITIAHRLDTVLDCDRILVIDNGKIAEFDRPDILLQNQQGSFSRMYINYTNQKTKSD